MPSVAEASTADPADARVILAFWSALDLLRPLVLIYVVHQYVGRLEQVEHPAVGWTILAVLAAWTLATLFVRRRTAGWLAVELAIGVGGILASGWTDSTAVIEAGAPTVPGMWPSATVLSWAVLGGPLGGTCAALAIAIADLVLVRTPNAITFHNIVILLLLGSLVGYCAELVREGHRIAQEAEAVRARALERERLARSVHDGVLQALSFVHRRGLEIGGETGELGRLAAEQERNLRELLRVPVDPVARSSRTGEADGGTADLALLLTAHAGDRVSVVDTGDRVVMPRGRAREIDAAVAAALDNVERHAGPQARAWILLERLDSEVVVTVRDNGVGIPPGRLAQARDEGRLGVCSSIVSRMRDLGGRADITSSGSGTQVVLRAPVSAPAGTSEPLGSVGGVEQGQQVETHERKRSG